MCVVGYRFVQILNLDTVWIHLWPTEYYSLTTFHTPLHCNRIKHTDTLEHMQTLKHLHEKRMKSCFRVHKIYTKCSNYGNTSVRMWIRSLQLSCSPFHVVGQHSTRYHFTGMRSVYDFYEYKRKHSHKFWQGESLSWLVGLGEGKKKRDKRQQGLWLGTRTGIEGSSTYINHSLLIHPFILWDKVQAGPWLGSC